MVRGEFFIRADFYDAIIRSAREKGYIIYEDEDSEGSYYYNYTIRNPITRSSAQFSGDWKHYSDDEFLMDISELKIIAKINKYEITQKGWYIDFEIRPLQ